MKFPSIKHVAAELRAINADAEGDCDVRLQVYEDGAWAIRVGSSDYDLDHRGYWGASSVPGKRFNATDTARDLIEQAREAHAQSR